MEFTSIINKCNISGLIKSGDRILLALSGGVDSICLYHVLRDLQKKITFDLLCLHVHHGIRKLDADLDETLVRELCERDNISYIIKHFDVPTLSKEYRLSIEETGREVRRQAMLQVAHEFRCNKVALAHHQDDSVETFLLNLCRGTGIQGLLGIQGLSVIDIDEQDSPITIIRPFLPVSKKEIIAYALEQGFVYREDQSNHENVYTRNSIRNEIIPLLKDRVNEQTTAHISALMTDLYELQEFFQEQVDQLQQKVLEVDSYTRTCTLTLSELRKCHISVQKAICQTALYTIAGHGRDITRTHIQLLLQLMEGRTGARLDFPYHITAYKDATKIVLTRNKAYIKDTGTASCSADPCKEEIHQETSEVSQVGSSLETTKSKNDLSLRQTLISRESYEQLAVHLPYTKCIDYAIIERGLILRTRQSGDYITINSHHDTQSLNRYYINQKIPARLRDTIPVVADGSEIVWVVGYRLNQKYYVTDQTNNILQLEYMEVETDGRDN